jgi:hypothetical protein
METERNILLYCTVSSQVFSRRAVHLITIGSCGADLEAAISIPLMVALNPRKYGFQDTDSTYFYRAVPAVLWAQAFGENVVVLN